LLVATSLMANTVLITSVTGILVSGVVGPGATAWAARRSARKQFIRDRAAKGREDLRGLLDEAASVLGVGPIRLRTTWEAQQARRNPPEEARAWPDAVYVLGQRLRLRLGAEDPVVKEYDVVRARLVEAGKLTGEVDDERHENALLRFESAREKFLTVARAKLDAPIPDKEAG